jgi:hypothetical protein
VKPGRRVARVEGFSLHADTWVHANDREGLVRLCRYGARGPLALGRLSLREDGQYAYRTKKGLTLVWSAAQLLRRLLPLLAPKRKHLTGFYGVFSSHAKRRAEVVGEPEAERRPLDEAAGSEEGEAQHASSLVSGDVVPDIAACSPPASPARRPRLDWATLQRRTFGADVWACPCGGKRRVLALVTQPTTAQEILFNLGLGSPPAQPPLARARPPPPQLPLAM